MKTGWKTALTIIGATILGLSIPFGALYVIYRIEDKKHISKFNNAVQKANQRVEQLSLADLTYNEFVLMSEKNIIATVNKSINDIPELIPTVTVVSMTYHQDGTVEVQINVDYINSESADVVAHATFTKNFTITDSSEATWVAYHLKVELKPEIQEQTLSYRTFVSINADNIDDYITYEKLPQYQYSTIGQNVMDNLANPYINKETKSLNFYLVVNNGSERILSNLQDLPLNVNDPVLLTSEKVEHNFSPDGIWYGKTLLTPTDYTAYDYINNDAFSNHHLDELQLLANADIVPNAAAALQFPGVDKITLLEQTATSSLFIQDNILYSRIIFKEEEQIAYFVGALTIADRTMAMDEIVLFDDAFLNPYSAYSFCPYVADNFYDAVLFQNIKKINLENTHLAWVGIAAFKDCQILSDNIRIVDNYHSLPATEFMPEAFAGSNVVHFEAQLSNPAVAITFGEECFAACRQLQSVDVTYAAYVLTIDHLAFYNCDQLTNIHFHKTITAFTTTYLLLEILEMFVELLLLMMLVVVLVSVLLLANPIFVAAQAFGTSTVVNETRTISFGGGYSLWLDNYALGSLFKTTDVYVNDTIYEDPETHQKFSSINNLPLTNEVLAYVTTLHVHQVGLPDGVTFDKSVYPSAVHDKIVEEINYVK